MRSGAPARKLASRKLGIRAVARHARKQRRGPPSSGSDGQPPVRGCARQSRAACSCNLQPPRTLFSKSLIAVRLHRHRREGAAHLTRTSSSASHQSARQSRLVGQQLLGLVGCPNVRLPRFGAHEVERCLRKKRDLGRQIADDSRRLMRALDAGCHMIA